MSAAISIQFCAAGEDSAGRVPCACFAESAFTKKRWQKLRDAQDERLRFQVERYIWDRAEGKPSTLKLEERQAGVREITVGNLPMPSAD